MLIFEWKLNVRNCNFSRYVRFNTMHAIVLDVLLIFPDLLEWTFNPRDGVGLELMMSLESTVLLFLLVCLIYGSCTHLEKIYMDNIDASVAALRKLAEEWKLSGKQSSLEALRGCLKSLRGKISDLYIFLILFVVTS
ncbi:unnamed protein product [Fraxinus pennsylvanica]|uniref:Protein TIC 20 n=1 Tax=Fraxinus pennsylvanica TaxID=56036 RepID=A0AAD2DKU0_9LAMI|nr:unnamed protein product [Fraxinus pennsylvanica]